MFAKNSKNQNDFFDLAKTSNFDDLIDIANFTITSFNENISETPIMSYIIATLKTGKSINDYLLLKKIATFLYNLNTINKETRVELIEKKFSSLNERNYWAEKILLLLQSADDMNKAKFISNLFSALIFEKIDFQTFEILVGAVLNLSIQELYKVENDIWNLNVDTKNRMFANGLLVIIGMGKEMFRSDHYANSIFNYDLSKNGELFKQYAFTLTTS